jgi:hypothetical protein
MKKQLKRWLPKDKKVQLTGIQATLQNKKHKNNNNKKLDTSSQPIGE